MKILIATGIFPPDIGGPAYYAKHLAEEFVKLGHDVEVIAYGRSAGRHEEKGYSVSFVRRSLVTGFRHIAFCWAIWKRRNSTDVIIALDTFSAGFPVALGSLFYKTLFIVRSGGDFLWERSFERRKTDASLSEFYTQPLSVSGRFFRLCIAFVLRRARRVICSTAFQKHLYEEHYGVASNKAVVVHNPVEVPSTERHVTVKNKIVFAGRFLRLKNIERVIDAFSEVAKNDETLTLQIIGEGPERDVLIKKIASSPVVERITLSPRMAKEKLLTVLLESKFLILPSISDVSPNLVFESLSVGTPVLMTQETGIRDELEDKVLFIDPRNMRDIVEKMKLLLTDTAQRDYRKKIQHGLSKITWAEYTNRILKEV